MNWLAFFLKTLLDWGLQKLAPIVEAFFRKKKIDREIDDEKEIMDEINKEITQWVSENPGKPLPKYLEDKLREHAGRRTNRL